MHRSLARRQCFLGQCVSATTSALFAIFRSRGVENRESRIQGVAPRCSLSCHPLPAFLFPFRFYSFTSFCCNLLFIGERHKALQQEEVKE
mmetsp:Transcript_27685/g.70713  ORF Transcript_27685/g.70713 Transcript_27685/m.70713 type:complete len:90 (+) Transcript_27685:59-328(+)